MSNLTALLCSALTVAERVSASLTTLPRLSRNQSSPQHIIITLSCLESREGRAEAGESVAGSSDGGQERGLVIWLQTSSLARRRFDDCCQADQRPHDLELMSETRSQTRHIHTPTWNMGVRVCLQYGWVVQSRIVATEGGKKETRRPFAMQHGQMRGSQEERHRPVGLHLRRVQVRCSAMQRGQPQEREPQ